MKLDEYIKTRGNVDVAPEELDKLLGVNLGRQKPKYGDEYWFISSAGCISVDKWCNLDIDNHKYYTNNCFPTMDAAEQKLRVIETEIELRKYAEKYNEAEIDWGNDQQLKWYLAYGCLNDDISFNVTLTVCIPKQIYFTSAAIAQDAIVKIGEGRIKEYLKYYSEIGI